MKIKDIQVDGFGVWNGLTIESLSHSATVFYGQNEAGKTTLMQFVRSMMFGFSEERQEKYLPPVYGGIAGGSVAITSSHGAHEIQRHFNPKQTNCVSDLAITDLDSGTAHGQSQLTEILSEIDESIFNNVFAIGLREIQELSALNSTDASEMLYKLTSGMDRVSLVDVMRDWDTKREQILSSTINQPSTLLEVETRKQTLLCEIDDLKKRSIRWTQLTSETNLVATELQQLTEEYETLEKRSRLLDIAMEISERWQSRAVLKEQVKSFGALPEIDGLKVDQLDDLNRQGKALGEKIRQIKQQRRDKKAEAMGLAINPGLWTKKNRIDALAEHTPWIESLQRQVDRLQQEVQDIESGMVGEVAGLGSHLNIRSQDVKDLEKRNLSRLKSSAKSLLRRQNQYKQIQSEVEEAEFDLLQLQERLNIKADKGTTPGSLEETSKLVARLRQRIELDRKIGKLDQSRCGLKRDIDEIVNEQALPVSKLAILGVVFVMGTVLIGFGLIDWMNAGTYLGQGSSNTGFLLMIMGAVCGFLSIGMKYHWERVARESLEDFRHQTDVLRQQLRRSKSELNDIQNQLPESMTDFQMELSDAEGRLVRLEALAPMENQVHSTQARLQDQKRNEASKKHELETTLLQWQGQLRVAGLPETLQPLQVKEIIQRSGRITDTMLRLEGLKTELEEREKELKTIRARVKLLLTDCGLDFEDVGVLDLLNRLESAIHEQRSLVQLKKTLIRKYRGLGNRLSKYRRDMEICRQQKQQLLADAGATTEVEFREIEVKLSTRTELREKQDHLTNQISAALGTKFTEDDVAEWMAADGKTCPQQHGQQVQGEIESVRERQTLLHQQRGEYSLELKMLGEDSRLDEARLELNSIDAQIDEHKRQWKILATSSKMLESIREEYESKRQPESLKEASGYLHRLTEGQYQRIWTRMVGKELLCDTVNNETITVDKLSRGTREAVYLSLRLALVGAFAKRGKVLPMVLDDVLVNFDSRRAQAAAELLCDFSSKGYQLLIFTCHEHIANMFHEMKANVKILPHHLQVAGSHAVPSDYSPNLIKEPPNPVPNEQTAPTVSSKLGKEPLDMTEFDSELEYELSAVNNDELAEQKLRHELVYFFSEDQPAVQLSDIEGAWHDSKRAM